MLVSCTVFVLSGRGLCDGPIPRPEESYRPWCVSECDQVKIKTTSTPAVNRWKREGLRNETKPISGTRDKCFCFKLLYIMNVIQLDTGCKK
jgi:hypothetical protein